MTTGCTIVTELMPDERAMLELLSDIDPELRVHLDPAQQCLAVFHPTRDSCLIVVEASRLVQVPGEVQRIFGSDLGLPQELLQSSEGLFWTDVHMVESSDDSGRLLILFARNLSERGRGSYVELGPDFLAFPCDEFALRLHGAQADTDGVTA